jgi:hypothetical protein
LWQTLQGCNYLIAGKNSLLEPRDELELERNTLRLLCAECLETEKRHAFCQQLQPELFLDPIHRVLYEEICALRAADANRLRELLAPRLTNRGFPDADLGVFVSNIPVQKETLEEWVRCAKSLAAARR